MYCHAQLRACRLRVANGDSQGVGGIVGLWHFGKVQQSARHFHYLRLLSLAVARDRGFDLKRRVLKNRDFQLLRREQRHASRLSHLYRGLLVGLEKEPLNRERVGTAAAQNRIQLVLDILEPRVEVGMRLGFHRAVADRSVCVGLKADRSPADNRVPRVYSENNQNITSDKMA